jgi:hypothetical protein
MYNKVLSAWEDSQGNLMVYNNQNKTFEYVNIPNSIVYNQEKRTYEDSISDSDGFWFQWITAGNRPEINSPLFYYLCQRGFISENTYGHRIFVFSDQENAKMRNAVLESVKKEGISGLSPIINLSPKEYYDYRLSILGEAVAADYAFYNSDPE